MNCDDPRYLQLLVTFDKVAQRAMVRHVVGINYASAELLVDGRSLNDVEKAIEAAGLEHLRQSSCTCALDAHDANCPTHGHPPPSEPRS